MTAYSFAPIFKNPILIGLGLDKHVHSMEPKPVPKRQTIRAIGKKRHARVGERVQLYIGLPTKHPEKLGEGICTKVSHIKIELVALDNGLHFRMQVDGRVFVERKEREAFARADGFVDVDAMQQFWQKHNDLRAGHEWHGLIIHWEPIK